MSKLYKLVRDKRGVMAIEYALIASLISVAAIAAFANLGGNVDKKYQSVDNNL